MDKKSIYISLTTTLLLVSITFLTLPIKANAAERVRIATIGTRTPTLDKSMGYQKMVEQMIAFWEKELDQVIHDKPDLIVLPENCDFPWGLTHAERNEYVRVRGNQIRDYFASVAKSTNSYFAFGMRRIDDDGAFRNSGVLLDRQGELVGIYDKNFPTIREIENGIKPSPEIPVFECDFGRVAIAICYDLNFDELRERYQELDLNLIIFPSAYHGGFIQSTWAYTCRAYFVGSISGQGAPSQIRNPLGEVVASSTNYFNYTVADVNLDYELAHLDYNWRRLRELKKKYNNQVQITDPGELGAVLISSEHDNVSASAMAKEFKIEILDDYFQRSRASKKSHE